jgi:hypothetical protein
MNLVRLSFLAASLTFMSSALVSLASPQRLADMVELSPSRVGFMELRAVYGGLFIGLGVFFLLCFSRESWFRPGLVAQVCVMGGIVTVRLLTLVLEGAPSLNLVMLLALEAGVLVLGAVALRSLSSKPAV